MFVPRLSTLKIAVLKQGIGEQMSLSSPENPQLGIATIRYLLLSRVLYLFVVKRPSNYDNITTCKVPATNNITHVRQLPCGMSAVKTAEETLTFVYGRLRWHGRDYGKNAEIRDACYCFLGRLEKTN